MFINLCWVAQTFDSLARETLSRESGSLLQGFVSNKKANMEITQEEFNRLSKAAEMLYALEAAGVDNWGGYSVAMESLAEQEQ